MTQKAITDLYRQFRRENENNKPNRVIVRMYWEDEPENKLVDTIAFVPARSLGWVENMPFDSYILYYVSSLKELIALTKPGNGSDFVIDEVLEFYKY